MSFLFIYLCKTDLDVLGGMFTEVCNDSKHSLSLHHPSTKPLLNA